MRLDRYLTQLHPNLSRHYLKELILAGKVLVNKLTAKPSYQVKEKDLVEATISPKSSPNLLPESIPLNIVFENEDIIVIDKPSGLVVHPAAGHRSGTLINALLAHLGSGFAAVGESSRPGLVHRLDKDTSGLLVVAKNETARVELVRAFSGRRVKKEYLALVKGKPPEPAGEISSSVGRDPKNRLKFAVRADGKPAVTRYFTERVFPAHTLLRLEPVTGRTHQLRVHLASISYPIVGDKLYGGEEAARLFLHASSLSFRLKGQDQSFSSVLPKDLTKIIETIS